MNKHTHLCSGCGELDGEYVATKTEIKICTTCGGRVLNIREAADKILELKEELDRAIQYSHGPY